MAVDYRFKKGVDSPSWQWMNQHPGVNAVGTSNCYDGKRYQYWLHTSQIWKFDTWTNTWVFLATVAATAAGGDIEYDGVRNALLYTAGGTTAVTAVNLNTTNITVANVVCTPLTPTAIAALPVAVTTAGSLTLPDDLSVTGLLSANGGIAIDTATVVAGSTTTTINSTSAAPTFGIGMIGLQVRFTTGALANQKRIITGVPNGNTVTVNAFGAAPSAGDVFVIEVPEGTATSGTVSTLVQTGVAWTANQYANSDVVIVAGTGNGQRRRIASNTVDTLTLSAAVTGNARTGNFATAPDATSVYRIVPSSDFLYYQNLQTLFRLDLAQTTGAAWSAALAAPPAGVLSGGNTFHPGQYAPFQIILVRGGATPTIYNYNIGLNSWTTFATFMGTETVNNGSATAMMHGKRRIFVQQGSSGRCFAISLVDGTVEGAGMMPYANPAANDGKRARFCVTPDGVEWIYVLRNGGQEFFRMPVEWL